MFDALWRKMITSRKFVVLAVTLVLKLVSPLVAKWGLDLSFVEAQLNDWMPVVLTYIAGQSVVDAAKVVNLPPPPDDPTKVPGEA